MGAVVEQIKKLVDIALRLEGLYRHASTHAAGIVIGDRPLEELVALLKASPGKYSYGSNGNGTAQHLIGTQFQNLTGDSTITAAISALAIEVVTGFAPFTNVAVSLGGRGDQAAQQGQREGYELTGVVRRAPTDAGLYQVSAILTDLDRKATR